MLSSKKASLVADFSLDFAEVRQLEINYWRETYKRIGTLCAGLFGIASTVLGMTVEKTTEEHPAAIDFLILLCTLSMGLSGVILSASACCCTLAPGRALFGRGNTSYDKALGILEDMHAPTVYIVKTIALLQLVSMLVYSAALKHRMAQVVCLIVLSWFCYVTVRHTELITAALLPANMTSGGLISNFVDSVGDFFVRKTSAEEGDPLGTRVHLDRSFAANI